MKLEVFNQPQVAEKTVRLKLEQDTDGEVMVVAVDEAGEVLGQGYLLYFTVDGRVRFTSNVNPNLGFDLDGNGELIVA